jgi:flavin reductase (DIM6/NTAB) family NADH-FMN oxidoreductase RutF
VTDTIELLAAGLPGESLDIAGLRGVYGRFPTGVMAVAALSDREPIGLTVSSFNTVSMVPPLVVISIQAGSATWPLIEASPRLGLSVMATDQLALSKQLAGKSDRFAGVAWSATQHGAVLIEGAAAWLECNVEKVVTVGDHDMAILHVQRFAANGDKAPLVFHDSNYHGLAGLG